MAIEKVIIKKPDEGQKLGGELVAPARLSERESSKDLSQDQLKQRARQVALAHWEYEAKKVVQASQREGVEGEAQTKPQELFSAEDIIENGFDLLRLTADMDADDQASVDYIKMVCQQFLAEGRPLNHDLVYKAVSLVAENEQERLQLFQQSLEKSGSKRPDQLLPHQFYLAIATGNLETWANVYLRIEDGSYKDSFHLDGGNYKFATLPEPEYFAEFSEITDVTQLVSFYRELTKNFPPKDGYPGVNERLMTYVLEKLSPVALAAFIEQAQLRPDDSLLVAYGRSTVPTVEHVESIEAQAGFECLAEVEGIDLAKLGPLMENGKIQNLGRLLSIESAKLTEQARELGITEEDLEDIYKNWLILKQALGSRGIFFETLVDVDDELVGKEEELKKILSSAAEQELLFAEMKKLEQKTGMKLYDLELLYQDVREKGQSEDVFRRWGKDWYTGAQIVTDYEIHLDELVKKGISEEQAGVIYAYHDYSLPKIIKSLGLKSAEQLAEVRGLLFHFSFGLGSVTDFRSPSKEDLLKINNLLRTVDQSRQAVNGLLREEGLDRETALKLARDGEILKEFRSLPFGLRLRKAMVLAETGSPLLLKSILRDDPEIINISPRVLESFQLEDMMLLIKVLNTNLSQNELAGIKQIFGALTDQLLFQLAAYAAELQPEARKNLSQQLVLLSKESYYRYFIAQLSGSGQTREEDEYFFESQYSAVLNKQRPEELDDGTGSVRDKEKIALLEKIADCITDDEYRVAWSQYATAVFLGETQMSAYSSRVLRILEKIGITPPSEKISDAPPEILGHLEVLGLSPAELDQKIVKSKYRQLARQLHPDANKDADAEEKFKQLNEANEALTVYFELLSSQQKIDEIKFEWWQPDVKPTSYDQYRSAEEQDNKARTEQQERLASEMVESLKRILADTQQKVGELNRQHHPRIIEEVQVATAEYYVRGDYDGASEVIWSVTNQFKIDFINPIVSEALSELDKIKYGEPSFDITEEDRLRLLLTIHFVEKQLLQMMGIKKE